MANYNLAPHAVKGKGRNMGSCNNPLERSCSSCSQCKVGALYCLRYLQELVKEGCWDYLNYRYRIRPTLEKYLWNANDVEKILLNMSTTEFQRVVLNCAVHELPGFSEVNADQYETRWDGAYLSIKLALVEEDGELTGLVTLHSSGS